MSEKLYALLLKLYPDHFRRTYGDQALRLVRDRARDEKGFLSGLRLWLDLLMDLAISLPREYSRAQTTRIVAAQPVNGDLSFQLLAERSLNPALLFLAGMLSAVLFWVCASLPLHAAGYSRHCFGIRVRCNGLCRAIWLWLGLILPPYKKNQVLMIQGAMRMPCLFARTVSASPHTVTFRIAQCNHLLRLILRVPARPGSH